MQEINKLILQEAYKLEGTWEWAGDDHNPVVVKMYAESGHPEIKRDEVPWCAAFVGAVLARVGKQNTGSLLAKSYLNWGEKVSYKNAMPGDIVVLHRGNASWQGHVGFLVKKDRDYVHILGGNQNNQVNVTKYPVKRLAGVRRVKYDRKSEAQSKTLQATAAGATGTVTAGATAISHFDGTAQLVTIIALAVVAVALLVVFRERIQKWAAGDR